MVDWSGPSQQLLLTIVGTRGNKDTCVIQSLHHTTDVEIPGRTT